MYGQNAFLLEVMISKALVLFQSGERQPAQATLDQEVGMVEREGYIRSFVDFGVLAEDRLRDIPMNSKYLAYVHRLL
jgi:hypothetical protein